MADPDRIYDQTIRFGLVGIISNALLYALYLILTALGIGPKLAMTLAYAIGVMQSFILNRRWTFGYRGASHDALVRYLGAHAFGYVLNWLILWFAVDRLGLGHQWVQLPAIAVVAASTFLLNRYWVFSLPTPKAPT